MGFLNSFFNGFELFLDALKGLVGAGRLGLGDMLEEPLDNSLGGLGEVFGLLEEGFGFLDDGGVCLG